MTRRMLAPIGLAAGLLSFGLLLAQEPTPAATSQHRGERRALAGRVDGLEKQVAELRDAVDELRGEPSVPASDEFKIFTLQHASAADLMPTITTLFRAGRPDRNPRVAVDERTNSLIAAGSEEQLKTIEALLVHLDQSDIDRLTTIPKP